LAFQVPGGSGIFCAACLWINSQAIKRLVARQRKLWRRGLAETA